MTSKLDGPRARIDRSKAIIDGFNREVLGFFRAHPHRVFFEPSADAQDERIIYMEPPDELPGHWPLVVGEFLHEVRSALDNLVWMLAEAHVGEAPWPLPRESAWKWRRVQFPVYESGQGFQDATREWAEFLDPEDWRLLESVQPFDDGDREYLIRLTELNNADKHRTIPLLTTFHEDVVGPPVWFPERDDAEVTDLRLNQRAGACRGKTELGRVTVRQTGPNPKIRMEEQFAFEVAVDHPYAANMTAVDLMMWMQIHARGIIDLFSDRYPDLVETNQIEGH